MTTELTLVPRGPYSLAASARMRSDATCVYRDGVLSLAFRVAGRPRLARVFQRRDGPLAVSLEPFGDEPALEHVRFVLGVDDDTTPFLRRFAADPLLGPAIRRVPGFRPLRASSVAHAVLKAVCGQLIQARAARLLEARLLRLASPEHQGLRLPPVAATFARFAPAELAAQGLVSRKANALVRLSRELDLERLHRLTTPDVRARLERERGIGPWSSGVVALYGLGRYDHGLVGDLGLVKLCASLHRRFATAEDTRELLARYGEWRGLASAYLVAAAPATVCARDESARARAAPVSGPTSAGRRYSRIR